MWRSPLFGLEEPVLFILTGQRGAECKLCTLVVLAIPLLRRVRQRFDTARVVRVDFLFYGNFHEQRHCQ